MNNEHLKCGLRPQAQALPQRGFCPGGRASWLGEIADCGRNTPNSLRARGPSGPEALLRTPCLRRNASCRQANFKGMTLIEVIMVMAIIGILAATVIPRFDFATSSRASVDGAAYMIASDIRYAQEFAMANRVSKSVTFTNGSSVYTFSPASTGMDPSGRLPSGVTITSTSPSPCIVTFNSLGEPIVGGNGSVTVSSGGQSRTITVVNYTGKVNIS